MPAPTRRGLFSLLLAGLAWLCGRRSSTATPPPAVPVPATPDPYLCHLAGTGPTVATFVYDVTGNLVAVREDDAPTVTVWTYDGVGRTTSSQDRPA